MTPAMPLRAVRAAATSASAFPFTSSLVRFGPKSFHSHSLVSYSYGTVCAKNGRDVSPNGTGLANVMLRLPWGARPASSLHNGSSGGLPSSSNAASASTTPFSSPSSPLSPSSPSSSSSLPPSLQQTVNPPHTTRPPPLVLPDRAAASSTMGHLFATGKAYLAFYKMGLRFLYTNTKLVRQQRQGGSSIGQSNEDGPALDLTTRAGLLLRQRWRHDMRRLPLFGLLLLVCGEFTPLIVLAVPHVVPYPCRIPKQVDKLRRLTEARRQAAFAKGAAAGSTDGHGANKAALHLLVARSLGLVAPLWDRLDWMVSPPTAMVHWAVAKRLRFLHHDDALLRQAGGAAALVDAEEVRLACADRGLDVRPVLQTNTDANTDADANADTNTNDVETLRRRLDTWLALTASDDLPPAADVAQKTAHLDYPMAIKLLTTRPEHWPTLN